MHSVETIFAEALNRSNPAERRRYLEQACRGDLDLLRQVDELIKAHENAGDFLESSEPQPLHRPDSAAPTLGSGLPAGHYARAFLRQLAESGEASLDRYLASIPPPVRIEAQQRVAAFQSSQTVLLRPVSAVSAPSPAPPRIPGFRVERKLGEGGLGAVYLAIDEKLQRPVALKVLAGTDDSALRSRIVQEARRAASLRDPAIVTIHAVHEEGGCPAIIMEYLEGFPVDRAAASLTFPQKARLLQEIARALAVAHRRGLLHRDLKPENVLVTPELRPKILDFGLAVSLEEASMRRRFFEGTPRYASPEQVAGEPLTTASDIFSLGSLMFKVLTGRAPFDGATTPEVLEAICTSEPPFLRDVSVGVPEDLQAICLACLAWDPAQRPSAQDLALDLGRYLAGEPVRLRPALYGDILRRRITEFSTELVNWENQGMISADEHDRLQKVHRRILADEDHWIIDARKVSAAQTFLYTGTWMVVLASVLLVWLVGKELPNPLNWLAPMGGTLWLLAAGMLGSSRREPLACASFLAGAVLSWVPASLALLGEFGWLSISSGDVQALLPGSFTNTQILFSSVTALGISSLAWARLRMTGFAWTTAALATLSYLSWLLCLNWLAQEPEVMALWCLPLVSFVGAGLWAERIGRVRWALPFHLVAFVTLVGALDVMAAQGPTLAMLGLGDQSTFLNAERQRYFSLAGNGYLFLLLMVLLERSHSLDLRRASRVLEPLALLHILAALYANAQAQRDAPDVLIDVSLYAGSVLLLLLLGPWRSRWRILVGALGGLALGSHLLIDLELVRKTTFTLGLGIAGLLVSAGTYLYLWLAPRAKKNKLSNS